MNFFVELVVYGVVIVGCLLWTWPRCIGLWVIMKGLWNEAKDWLENR